MIDNVELDSLRFQVADLTSRLDESRRLVETFQQRAQDYADTLNAWFDREKLDKDQIGPKILDAAKGYLRRSRSGGMEQDTSDTVEAVIEDMLRLGYLTAPITRYLMTSGARVQSDAVAAISFPLTRVVTPEGENFWTTGHDPDKARWEFGEDITVAYFTAVPSAQLCQDEGCPHHGTDHVCNPGDAPKGA